MITEARSTTVAPLISAWLRSSAGIHFASSPKTGSRVGSPGRLPRKSPMASTVPGRRLAAGHLDAEQPDRVGAQRQVEVVAGAHRRHHDADVGGDLATQRLDPVEQVAAGAGVDQVDEVRGELEAERVHLDLGGQHLRRVRGGQRGGGRLGLDGLGHGLLHHPRRGEQQHAAGHDERDLRQARDQAQEERGEARRPAAGCARR